MNLFKISLAYIYRRKLNTLLNMVLLGLERVLSLFCCFLASNLKRICTEMLKILMLLWVLRAVPCIDFIQCLSR